MKYAPTSFFDLAFDAHRAGISFRIHSLHKWLLDTNQMPTLLRIYLASDKASVDLVDAIANLTQNASPVALMSNVTNFMVVTDKAIDDALRILSKEVVEQMAFESEDSIRQREAALREREAALIAREAELKSEKEAA